MPEMKCKIKLTREVVLQQAMATESRDGMFMPGGAGDEELAPARQAVGADPPT